MIRVSGVRFTGERLHDDALFALDLARHRAAYEFARVRAAGPVSYTHLTLPTILLV